MFRAFTLQTEQQLYMFAQGLLAHVATDYNLDHAELVKKYLEKPQDVPVPIRDGKDAPAPVLVAATQEKAKKARKPGPEKVLCKGITAKGTPCKFGACGPEGLCKKHLTQTQSQAEGSTKPKAPKKAVKPRHEHLVEETPLETCQVCESHGNAVIPEMPREEFEISGADEIRDRLKRIMAESGEESVPEPEPEPEESGEEPEVGVSLEDLGVSQEDLMDKETEDDDADLQERLKNILSAEDSDEEEDED